VDERLVLARARFVNEPRQEFLARAALALDQTGTLLRATAWPCPRGRESLRTSNQLPNIAGAPAGQEQCVPRLFLPEKKIFFFNVLQKKIEK